MQPRQPREHFHAGRFRNRYGSGAPRASWGFIKFLLRMRGVSESGERQPSIKPDVAWIKANRSAPALTWIGHASFLLQLDGVNIVTDPHLTQRASPFAHFGPPRFSPPALDFADLPPLDLALISHDHYDHLDARTVKRLAREHPRLVFVVPKGLKRWFSRRRIHKVIELDLWGQVKVAGATVHCVPAQHFSGRGPRRNLTLWCGFVIELAGRKIYFAGDTGYSQDFRDIGEKFAPIDLALLPIGAYDPREYMAAVHVNPAEAVRIHQDIGSTLSVAMHWGTFRLTLEPLDEPPRQLAQALAAANIAPDAFRVLKIGETLRLPF